MLQACSGPYILFLLHKVCNDTTLSFEHQGIEKTWKQYSHKIWGVYADQFLTFSQKSVIRKFCTPFVMICEFLEKSCAPRLQPKLSFVVPVSPKTSLGGTDCTKPSLGDPSCPQNELGFSPVATKLGSPYQLGSLGGRKGLLPRSPSDPGSNGVPRVSLGSHVLRIHWFPRRPPGFPNISWDTRS